MSYLSNWRYLVLYVYCARYRAFLSTAYVSSLVGPSLYLLYLLLNVEVRICFHVDLFYSSGGRYMSLKVSNVMSMVNFHVKFMRILIRCTYLHTPKYARHRFFLKDKMVNLTILTEMLHFSSFSSHKKFSSLHAPPPQPAIVLKHRITLEYPAHDC